MEHCTSELSLKELIERISDTPEDTNEERPGKDAMGTKEEGPRRDAIDTEDEEPGRDAVDIEAGPEGLPYSQVNGLKEMPYS